MLNTQQQAIQIEEEEILVYYCWLLGWAESALLFNDLHAGLG
jgi:hypothetical protein